MRSILVLALLTPLVPCLPVADADLHGACDVPGNVALGIITIGSGKADSMTIYLDDRNYVQGNGLWLYLESNHQDRLQLGGSSIIIPNDNEICIDDSPNGPDTLIM
jgi:hypothetical protein